MRSYSRAFWWGTVLNLVCLSASSMFVLGPRYLTESGLSKWEVGLCEGCYWVGSVISQPWLAGRLDRLGRKLFFVGGAAGMGVTALAFLALPPTLLPMAFLRLLFGVMVSTYFVAFITWIADQAPPGRMAEAIGYFGISGLLAGAVGPVAGEALIDQGGFRGLFVAAGVCGLSSALLMTTLREVRRDPLGERPAGEGFFALARVPGMRGVLLACLAFGYAIGSLYGFAAPFTALEGLRGTGLLFAWYTFSSVAVRLVLGRLSDRVGGGRIIPWGLLMQSVGLAAFAGLGPHYWRGQPLMITAGLLAGAGHGLLYPALSALAVERLGVSVRGTALAILTATINAGSILGATLSGLVAHLLGYNVMYGVVALALLLVSSTFPRVNREPRLVGA